MATALNPVLVDDALTVVNDTVTSGLTETVCGQLRGLGADGLAQLVDDPTSLPVLRDIADNVSRACPVGTAEAVVTLELSAWLVLIPGLIVALSLALYGYCVWDIAVLRRRAAALKSAPREGGSAFETPKSTIEIESKDLIFAVGGGRLSWMPSKRSPTILLKYPPTPPGA